MEDDTTRIAGRWQGFIPEAIGHLDMRIEIHIDSAPEPPTGTIHVADAGLVHMPISAIEVDDDAVELTTRLGVLVGVVAGDGSTMTLPVPSLTGASSQRFELAAGTPAIELTRDIEGFMRFDVPRLEAGAAYSYAVPAERRDGWCIADAKARSVSMGRLEEVVQGIIDGNEGRIEALVVARDGELILDEYFFGAQVDRPHTVQSVTKSITTLILGSVLSEHGVDVHAPVYTFFPHYSESSWVKQKYDRTIWHLLTMSAAVDWNEELPYTDPENSNTAMNASPSWVGYVLDRPLAGTPGLVSSYTSGFSILLGEILHRVAGKYVDEVGQEGLFESVGVSDFVWSRHADGTRHTGGGLWLTARDLAKFGQLVLDRGTWRGEQVVPASWVADSVKRQLPLSGAQDNDDIGYGYQWWLMPFERLGKPVPCVAGLGYGGQFLGVFPSLDLVVVLNAGEFVPAPDTSYDMNRLVGAILDSIE